MTRNPYQKTRVFVHKIQNDWREVSRELSAFLILWRYLHRSPQQARKNFSLGKKALSGIAVFVLSFGTLIWTANAQPQSPKKNTVDPNVAVFASADHYDTSSRGRAPEPSTVALMGSGFVAALVRFARRRFEEFKRGFDIFVALLGLCLSLPVLAMAALVLKMTSPGPVLFRQSRIGKDGEAFEILKLRTMVCDAEKQTGPVWAIENDPRVTPVGRFLRNSRIDELPQFINVLRGDMSLIGPRPERPEFVSTLSQEIADYPRRLRVRPGITGLAQIRRSYDATISDVRKKVKLDLLYIKRMCFLTDLRILWGTVFVVLTGRGAR